MINVPNLKRSSWIILAVAALLFALSVFLWCRNFPGIRRSFVFVSSDSELLRIENRFEPLKPAQGSIRNYVDELLLGPVSEHCRPVFAKGTRCISCFRRRDTLYVNLSEDLLRADAFHTDFAADIDLFKRNIFNNFRYIKKIELFVNGRVPFETAL